MIEKPHQSSPRILEWAVGMQAATLVVGVTWAFGGNADWVRTPISLWGSVGMFLTLCLLVSKGPRKLSYWDTASWALPIAILNGLVLVSCLTEGFRTLHYGSDVYYLPLKVPWWTPSSARPEISLRSLWLFDGLYFSAFNIALGIETRRIIRALLAVIVGNALLLSIFGSIQKLIGSTGIYFGAVKSPQDYFFASFVYDNHWGAFMILMVAACVGLILRYAFGSRGGGFFQGPSLFGLATVAMMALSVPLSGARACTLILMVLVVIALVRGTPKIVQALQYSGVPASAAYFGMVIVALFMVVGAWTIAGDVVRSRAEKAKAQVAEMWARGGLGGRHTLYHDTFLMAKERPVFGWGMGSFPTVFSLYNTQQPNGDRIPVVYHDAHSDWLQSAAEIGLVGTALIGLAVLLPARALRKKRISPIPYFLLAGCAAVAAYAWIEFPFGNVGVVLVWWVCYFCAVQYVRLSRNSHDATHGHRSPA